MDPYKILDVGEDASPEEIQRAYRNKAAKHHPDHGGDAWAFKQVREAYERLVQASETRSPKDGTRPATRPTPAKPTSGWLGPGLEKPDEPPTTKANEPRPAEGKSSSLRQALDRLRRLGFRQLPLQNETTIFILVNVLDIFMTYVLIRFGGVEANPIARFFLNRWGFAGMIFFKLGMVAFVTVLAQVIAVRKLQTARRLLQFGTVIVAIVVVYGLILFVQHV